MTACPAPVVSQAITVPGVAPVPTISPSTITTDAEGTAVTLTGTATDQSTVDTSAGFTFTWAVSKVNGTTTVANFATGTGTTLVFTPDDIGTYTVTLTAKDKDSQTGNSTQVITATAVAPTATITPSITAGTEGVAITLTGSASDQAAPIPAPGSPLPGP